MGGAASEAWDHRESLPRCLLACFPAASHRGAEQGALPEAPSQGV